jgi:hypothetical protein
MDKFKKNVYNFKNESLTYCFLDNKIIMNKCCFICVK